MNVTTGVWILYKKEIKEYFNSALVYILAALFSSITGWLFFNYIVTSNNLTQLSLSQSVLRSIFGNMNFLLVFMVPLICMKSFSQEKREGTLNLLFKSKLSSLQIIFAKFLSVVSVALFMISPTIAFPIILSFSGFSDWSTVIASYMGMFLCITCYVSVGLFSSSLTENQGLAAMINFFLLMGSMLIIVGANAVNNTLVMQIAQYLSFPYHFESFLRGAWASYNIAFFASVICFFLFLTERVIDSRNW